MINDGVHRGDYQFALTRDDLSWRDYRGAEVDLQPTVISIIDHALTPHGLVESTSLQIPQGSLLALEVRPLGKNVATAILVATGIFALVLLSSTARASRRTGSSLDSIFSGDIPWFFILVLGAIYLSIVFAFVLGMRRRWVVMQVGTPNENWAVAIRLDKRRPEHVADAISARLGTNITPS